MSHYQNRRPNQKYTHFDNEITGSYHNDSFFDGFDWSVAIAVAVMIVLAGAVLVLG